MERKQDFENWKIFSIFADANKKKTKKIAMITEDKITEIFCIVDDFCKFYTPTKACFFTQDIRE